ncbi:MAG: hypothetical protein NC911_03325 [Candidatus Omnitrophica bacterium]|nr:hypothetical protein [Candidatus Omnitrophota bacterium]
MKREICLFFWLFLNVFGDQYLFSQPEVLFYVSLDGHTDGYSPSRVFPNSFTSKGSPLTIFQFEKGIGGQAAKFTWVNGYPGLAYPVQGNYWPEAGSFSFWVKQTGPFFINRYYPHIWGLGSGQRDEIETHPLALVALNDEKAERLKDGQWHQIVLTWDLSQKKRWQYLDGQLLAEGNYLRPYHPTSLVFGYRMVGLMDEMLVLKSVLTEKEVEALYLAYRQGKTPLALTRPKERDYPEMPLKISHLSDHRPPLPVGADWNLKPARENGKRVVFLLDGQWRFQPALLERKNNQVVNPGFLGEDWAYISVPGLWKSRNGVRDREGKVISGWQGIPWEKISSVWLERDFALPEKHKNWQVLLVFPELRGNAEIYLNSQPIATSVMSGEVKVRLTDFVRWGQSNRLTILAGLPYVSDMDVNGLAQAPRLEIRNVGFLDVDSPLICPSVRTNTLKVILPVENLAYRPLEVEVVARLFSYQDGRALRSFSPVTLRIEKLFQGEKELTFKVNDLEVWTPDNPVLYRLGLEIREGKNLLDITLPEPFGFREVWVEDGKVMLNGSKLSIRGKSHNYLSSYGFTREEIQRLKLTGQNADRTLSPAFPYIDSLKITDEEGWLVFFQAPGVNLSDLEATRQEWKKMLRQVGNHPSVIAWQWSGNGFLNGPHGHPMQVGGLVSAEVVKEDENYVKARLVKQLDPTGRPVFYYRLGTGGDFRGIMTTLGFGTPLQQAEEWVSYWAKTKQDPLVPTEMQVYPIHHEGYLWQRGSKEIVLLEHYARFFGDQAYLKLTPAHLESYSAADKGVNLWLGPESEYKNDIYSLTYTRLLRSWRTYGISGYLFHVVFKTSELFVGEKLNRFGEALKKVNSSVLFYLSGPKDDFVTKDHTYWSGEKVNKSLIIVNESFQPLRASVSWRAITETGEILGTGMTEISLSPGQIDFQGVSFETKECKKKTVVKIEGTLKSGDLTLNDDLKITVRPVETRKIDGQVALIDSSGQTARLLEEMGVSYQIFDEATIDAGQWSWHRFPLLIIGKNSYPEAVRLFQGQLPFQDAIRDGLNLLVLEQSCRQVAGLKLENVNGRQVFVRDQFHPVFSGLGNQDFSDWRGESYLLPAYQPWHPASDPLGDNASKHGQLNSFGQRRFWPWSNKGMVATFAFEKPQVGCFRVLMDCGFDLLYTPLVEVKEGKGRILFNQLDLVDHYGREPVATLLLGRMINYLVLRDQLPVRKMGYVGGEKGKEFLKQLGVDYQEGWQEGVTYVSLEESGEKLSPEVLKDYVYQGGIVVVTLKSQREALLLPGLVKGERKKLDKPGLLSDPVFSGLGPSEFFFRQTTEIFQVVSVGEKPVENGVAGVLFYGKGKIIYVQVDPSMFEDWWQKSKGWRIYSTIFANLGVGSRTRIDMTAISGYGLPEEWLPGYSVVVRNLDNRPMISNSNFYLAPAINFDPDQHHVW